MISWEKYTSRIVDEKDSEHREKLTNKSWRKEDSERRPPVLTTPESSLVTDLSVIAAADNADKHSFTNISTNFQKDSQRPYRIVRVPGESV